MNGAVAGPPPTPGRPPVVLVVAGTDSSGGAGVAADLLALADLGVHGLLAVTAVTAQDDTGMRGSWPLPGAAVRAQLVAALRLRPAVVKTGMLAGAAAAEAVRDLVPAGLPMVVDPVLAASSGAPLLDPAGVAALRELVVPRATVLTPNLAEAEALTGLPAAGDEELVEGLLALGPRWVLLTGGHRQGEPVDLLAGPDGFRHRLAGSRVDTRYDRGTGCLLASSLAAGLARGEPVPAAAARAKRAVSHALAAGYPLARGYGVPRRGLRA